MLEVRRYLTPTGKDVVGDWLAALNKQTRARIAVRIDRLSSGNFGDAKLLGNGVWELRIDFGPGYRLYYGKVSRTSVLLPCGGDKRTQSSDISRAITFLKDYKERTSNL